jgi:fibronectin-binding autotransporter adhesin
MKSLYLHFADLYVSHKQYNKNTFLRKLHMPGKLIIFLAFMLLSASSAKAATRTWDGSNSTAWNVAANWAENAVPTSADDVYIGNFAPGNQPTLTANTTIQSLTIYGRSGTTGSRGAMLTINTGITLTITNNLSINGSTATGTEVQPGITLSGTGAVSVGANFTTTNATAGTGQPTITFSANGTITTTGNLSFSSSTALTAGTGTFLFNKTSGIQTVNNAAANDFYIINHSGAGTLQVLTNILATSNSFNNSGGGTFDVHGIANTLGDLQGNGTITSGIAGAITLTVGNDNNNSTFSGIIQNGSGTIALTKSGSGILTLSGNNTFSGALTIQNGTLSVPVMNDAGVAGPLGQSADAVVLGAGTVTSGTLQYTGATASSTKPLNIDFGGVAQIDGSGTVLTLSGQVNQTGTGLLTKTGPGTLTLAGTGDNVGLGVVANAGTLILAKTSSAGVHAIGGGGITVSGGTVQFGGSGGDQIYDGCNVTINSGTFDLNGQNETITVLTGSGGTILNNGGNSSILSFGLSITIGTTYTYSGVIANGSFGAGGVSLVKVGAGTQTLSGINTYTGSTTVNGGTLKAGIATQAFGVGSAVMLANTSGVVLDITGFNNTIGSLTGGGATGGNVTLGAAVLTVGSDNSSPAAYAGVISGTGAVTKIGVGTLILSRANLYTGLTTISDGTLQYGVANALSNGAVTVNGGTYNIAGFNDGVGAVTLINGTIAGTTGVLTGTSYAVQSGSVSAILAGAVALTKTTTGTVTMSGVNTYTGITTINAGVLSVATIGNGGVAGNLGQATSTATNLVLGGGTLQYTGLTASTNRSYTLTAATTSTIDVTANTLTISGAGANTTGALTKIGAGTLIFSGANLYTGLTTVSDGILRYGVASALSSGAVTVDGGSTFDIMTFSDAVGAVTLIDGTISGTTGVLTGTSYSVQNGTISAILAGAVTLTKSTTGIVTLSASNSYTGLTTISAGTLKLGAAGGATNTPLGTTGAGTVVSATGATLDLNGFTLGTAEALTLNGTGVSLGGALTNSSATAVSYSGLITLGSAASIIADAGTISVTNAGTIAGATFGLTLGGSGNGSVTSIIGNTTGGLIKDGSGIWTISGANTYTGATTITLGTLKLGGSERIVNTSALTVNGTFDLAGFSETVGSLAGNGSVTSSATGTLTLSFGGDNTSTLFSGVIGNGSATSVALTKTGTGIVTLSGTNTYTGTTTISAGEIELGAANVIPNNPVTLNGGTLSTGLTKGFSETIGAMTLSATSTIALGTGVHTITIANSSAATWGAFILNITGWTGLGGAGGTATAGKIMVGVGGLSAAQLLKVTFSGGYPTGAIITASGELVPNTPVIYYSKGSLAPNLTGSWTTKRDGSGTNPTNFTSGNIFVVQNGHSMTTSAVWSISGTNSRLLIENGGTLVASYAITLNAATYFQIDNGGTYKHQNTTAYNTSIFQGIESFGASSTVELNNSNTTGPGAVIFGNLTVNFTSNPGGVVNCAGALITINGNLSVQNTSSQQFVLTGATTFSLNIAGNLSVSGGTLNFSNGAGIATVNLSGNFALSTGTITESSTGSGAIIFNKTGTQTYTKSSGTISNTINFTVNSGSILDMGSSVLNGSGGTFTLNSGAGIITAHAAGVSSTAGTGCIQVTGTKTYSATADYTYNGSSAQVTGNGMAGADVLSIDNASGVTLSSAATVSTLTIGDVTANSLFIDGGNQITSTGTLNLTSGTLKLGASAATTFPAFATTNISAGATVEYASTAAQNVASAPAYSNITFSGASTKTFTGGTAVEVDNNLTINAGTLIAGSYRINISGNWINNGAYTAGSSTVTFLGTGSQAIGGSAPTTFFNLTGEKTTSEILNSNVTIEGALQLDKLDADFNTIILNGKTLTLNGTVAGNGSLNGDAAAILNIGGTSGGNLGTLLFTSGYETLNNLTLNRTGTAPEATIGTNLTVGSGGLNITNGVLTLDFAKALTVTGNTALTYTTVPCLVLKSDASGTASFIDNGTISGSGTARVERYITPYNTASVPEDWKFHFLSSPVINQPIQTEFVNLPNTTDDFFSWNEPTSEWVNSKDYSGLWNSTFESNFIQGKGYLVAYPTVKTKNFVGKPYTSNAGLLLTCTNTYAPGTDISPGWNLLGNPFPSPIDWDLVIKGSGMDNALYYYDNSVPRYRYYVSLTGGIGTALSGGSRYIPAMQGFMVHAKTTGTKTITMSNSNRVHLNLGNYYKNDVLTDNVLNIRVEGNNLSDDARICFYDQATENFDGDYDAYKLFSYNTTIPELYSVTTDSAQLAINTLPLSQINVTVPVGFLPGTAGTFTFTAEGTDRFPQNTSIFLEDLKTGTLQKLNDNPEYLFTSATDDAASRFLLHFQDASSITNPVIAQNFTVYAENGVINILQTQNLAGEVIITDMAGRTIASVNLIAGTPTHVNMQGHPGVYIVSIISPNGVSNAKIIVN